MAERPMHDPLWQQGYRAALDDLEQLAADLTSDRAALSDHPYAAELRLRLGHLCQQLRARLDGREPPPWHDAETLPAGAEREWTGG